MRCDLEQPQAQRVRLRRRKSDAIGRDVGDLGGNLRDGGAQRMHQAIDAGALLSGGRSSRSRGARSEPNLADERSSGLPLC
ncbi:MAG: hypothetical protein KF773_24095 [Deltaproteobacteria bacterium]|nr:hypothetical protein [Deltaproteobacteria bacterium]